ncbi:hypothetical protein Agabi119p4_7193 [Agaricus bisporus var. burnettii]|uniref:DOMON domain-containing protein n=1 Tax=Agaricus bisporus var. burnettii TaxID=192524 RepID=A0A8H7C7R9_AGABI|nr:hypothetical protein Agabi119p4_7193 [Agaricus bisporus var. burnettii]
MFPSTPQRKNSFHLVSLPHAIWLAVGTNLASSLQGAHAYSWNLRSDAKQCRNATIVLNGSGGKPPYKLLMIPYGATPLKVEARRIVEQVFATGDQTSGEIMVNYPADSQFVAVVSDASGFGTGGTSVATQVGDSDDSSCFDATKDVSPAFVFNIEPANQFIQCQSMRIWWDPATVQGNPTFQAVIPGGQSFTIPQGDHSRVPNQGIGFNWVPNVKTGTTVLLVGGDDRGIGTAGSGYYVVGGGTLNDASCLGSNPPSSTAGTPAGVALPTGGNHAGGGGGGGGGDSNTGAIVGGVVGGVAFISCLILVLFWHRRRHGHRKRAKERPVDLLHDDEDSEDDHRRNAQPQTQQQLDYYTPEPFLVPDPTLHSDGTSATDAGGGFRTSSDGRPISGTSFTRSDTQDLLGGGSAYGLGGYGWAGGSTTTNNSRKGAMRLRPVNIVQHEDAGPPPPPPSNGAGEEESETIELPPAYTAVQKRVVDAAEGSQPSVGGGSSTASAPIVAPATAMTATHPDTTAAMTSTGNATTPGVESGRQ